MMTLAGLGIGAVLVMALMWLFTLNQVTDTTTAAAASAIDESLSRSLDAGAKARVTMVRDGTGIDAPRRYVVRIRPSKAVASDPNALGRLAERAAQIVVGKLERVRGVVLVQCVSALPDGGDNQYCFRRTGDADSWSLEPVTPVPPLPSTADGK
jgi:hypothetical protein